MFGRNQKDSSETEGSAKIELRLLEDAGIFTSSDGTEMLFHGFDVTTIDGHRLLLSDSGPAIEGIFYFEIAGATNCPAASRLESNPPTQVILRHAPTNPHAGKAIEILGDGKIVGYVPAKLCPRMLLWMDSVEHHGITTKGSIGYVTKTFHKNGRIIGGEVLSIARGYGINMTAQRD